ncbi:Btbd1, partial [Symbiodinium sp. KB8]
MEEAKEDDVVRQGVGPLGLFPGDKVRLKGLKSDSTMNGVIGSFARLDSEGGEDRYTIELDVEKYSGPVSVRISNISK